VAWEGQSQDGSFDGIFGQRLQANTPPCSVPGLPSAAAGLFLAALLMLGMLRRGRRYPLW
jgi:hypothetical protein